MKSNAIKMMILLLATALLCFGTTMTVSASVDGADSDEPAIEATDDGSGAEEAIEATDEETDEESSDDMAGEEEGDDGEAEDEAADEAPAE
ncbi:MAG: hypothetical protein SD837_11680 [Candidatus Electrothrix scaldis]|nr:MAG: hypothetical protein SD837_11680 [Candidatus Electrothrix sp. GW3-3]